MRYTRSKLHLAGARAFGRGPAAGARANANPPCSGHARGTGTAHARDRLRRLASRLGEAV